MSIGILFIGIAFLSGIVCLFCVVHDTMPKEEQHMPQHNTDYTKLNPIELWEGTI